MEAEARPAPPAARPRPAASAPMNPAEELALLVKEWSALADKAGAVNPIIRNSMKDARPVAVDPDRVQIAFDPEFSESREKLNIGRNIRLLQKMIEDLLHRPVTLDLTIAPREGGEPSHTPEPAPGRAVPPAAASRKDWRSEAAVKRALDAFNGDIVDVRE